MKRAASIEVLLQRSNQLFDSLKRAYEASLRDKRIRKELKVDIKNVFENLRSCLDYLACDISESCCTSATKPNHLYFPIRASLTEFNSCISNDFPGLQTANRAVYDILKAVQPYHDPWLGHFNKLNNKNKHQDFVEQARTESRQVTVSSRAGSVTWGPGVTFGDGVRIMGVPIDPSTQLPVPNSQVKTEVVTWVDFRFKENGLSVLPFIAESLKRVEQVFRDLQPHT